MIHNVIFQVNGAQEGFEPYEELLLLSSDSAITIPNVGSPVRFVTNVSKNGRGKDGRRIFASVIALNYEYSDRCDITVWLSSVREWKNEV